MAYIPSAKDFEGVDSGGGYMPTAADFEEPMGLLDRLRAASSKAANATALSLAKHPTLSKLAQGAGNIAQPFNQAVEATPVPALAHGLLQSGGDTATFFGNLPAEAINALFKTNLQTAQMPDLSKYASSQENPLARMTGSLAADVIGPGTGVTKAAQSLPDLSKFSSQHLADELLARKKSLEDIYSKRYQSLVGGDSGAIPVEAPFINQQLKNAMPSDQKAIIARFQNKPTIANAHKAQSDIGKMRTALYAVPKEKRTVIDNENLKQAGVLRDAIRKSIATGFKDAGRPELADSYKAVTQGYKKDVVPFSRNQFLRQYQNKELEAPYLMKRLAGASKSAQTFRLGVGKNAPELQTFQRLKLAKKAALPIAALAALPGFHILKEFI